MTAIRHKKDTLIDQVKLAEQIAKIWKIDAGFTRILLDRIPIPNVESFRLLIESLVRISQTAWVAEAVETNLWPSVTQLRDILGKMPPVASFTSHDPKTVSIKDRYTIYSSLIDTQKKPAAWLETLRATLVMLAWHWANQKFSAKSTIASAIRKLNSQGLTKSKSSDDLYRLGQATSLVTLSDLAIELELPDRLTLNDVWGKDVKPFFQSNKSHISPVTAPTPPRPSEGRKATSETPDNETPRKPRIQMGIYSPSPVSREERAEAPQDSGVPVEIFDIPSSQQAPASQQRIDLYRAKQAIWTRDYLLMPDTFDSFSMAEAKILCKYLTEKLAQTSLDEARQLARLMLSIITGRSTKLLATGAVLGLANYSSSATWVLDPHEGKIRHLALRPDSAFKPDKEELKLLELISDELPLILPPTLTSFFRTLSEKKISLIGTFEEMEADIKEASKLATDALGFRVSPGRARRSISRLLQNESRDIVSTMLICCDTFGLSDAPLFYTCPRISDLQQLYLTVTSEMFGDDSWTLPVSEERVGARLLVKPHIWLERPKALADALNRAKSNRSAINSYRETHNALVDYLAAMIIDTAGHRPVDSLFQLTRSCFDLHGFGAVFQDKKSDPAHFCRFVAIPEVLASQIKSYLSHLARLAANLNGKSKSHVDLVIKSGAPLLFKLELDDSIQELSFSTWFQKLPNIWRALPPNASRTNIATRGRDLDAHPESLAIQLGHLETVGFPFSDCSPTIPLSFSMDLSPVLGQLASSAGWKCIHGIGDEQLASNYWELSGPIQNWSRVINAHEIAQQKVLRTSRDSLRANGRIARENAKKWVTEEISSVAPKLTEALATSLKVSVDTLEVLDQAAVTHIQKTLITRGGDDPIQSYASMNALRAFLNRARKRFGWNGFVPYRWRVARRPEGTPFFPEMLAAREQIEVLRKAFQKSSTKCPEGTDPVVWAFARTSLVLFLYGFIDSKEQLFGVLKNRLTIRRPASLPDLVLIQWCSEPCRVTELVGLAAIALGHLAWSYPENEIPDESALENAIKQLLPSKSVKNPDGILQLLASLVGVTNRIELSGAARTAADLKNGSTSAELSQQIHWIDGDKRTQSAINSVGEKSKFPSEKTNRNSVATKETRERDSFSPLAERQYDDLCALFPSANRDSKLSMTGKKIGASDIGRSRAKMIDELKAVSENPVTREVIAALSIWAAHMLEHGTAESEDPAFSTVEKYVSAIGSELVPLVKERRLTEMDETDLTALLVESVDMKKTSKSQALAAREIRNFYNIVAPIMGLPDVELDELSLYLSSEPDGVDAELIFPSEVELALSILNNESNVPAEQSLPKVRIQRQSSSSLSLIRATGTRSGELFCSRLQDLNFRENFSSFSVSRNRNRRLKTPAAKRRYLLEHRLSDAVRNGLAIWHDAENQRLTEPNRPYAYLFSAPASGKDFSTRQEIRDLVASALTSVTGRSTERLHRLRHLVGNEALMWASFSTADRVSVGHIRPLSGYAKNTDGVLYPRDYVCHTLLLGHTRPSTTIKAYLHLLWVLRSRSNQWMLNHVNRQSAAAAMGITTSGADRITQRRSSEPHRQAWLNHVIQPKNISESISAVHHDARPLTAVESISQMTVSHLSQILEWAEQGATLAASTYAAGASPKLLTLIRIAADEYKSQLGISFTQGDETQSLRPRVRRNSLTRHLYKLLDLLESDTPVDQKSKKGLIAVANALFTRARIRHRDQIVLPELEASILVNLLEMANHQSELIESTIYEDGPLIAIRVRRKTSSNIYAGLELKRILGIVWVQQRVLQLAELES